MALLIAIVIASNILYGQYVWIERGNSTAGGPGVYFMANTSWWVNTFGTCCVLAVNIMSDGLLVRNI